jgi:hypothetical protein
MHATKNPLCGQYHVQGLNNLKKGKNRKTTKSTALQCPYEGAGNGSSAF